MTMSHSLVKPDTAACKFYWKSFLGQVTLPTKHFNRILQGLSEKYMCENNHVFTNNWNHFVSLQENYSGKVFPEKDFYNT